jgi:hypothetical protein
MAKKAIEVATPIGTMPVAGSTTCLAVSSQATRAPGAMTALTSFGSS